MPMSRTDRDLERSGMNTAAIPNVAAARGDAVGMISSNTSRVPELRCDSGDEGPTCSCTGRRWSLACCLPFEGTP